MSERLDREINLRAIAWFAVGLVVICAASAVLMWYFSQVLREYRIAQDPPPPALAAAREPYAPPAPRLQVDPEGEMVELRAHEDEILGSYGWVDAEAGIARIPLERAIDLAVGELAETEEEPASDGEEEHR